MPYNKIEIFGDATIDYIWVTNNISDQTLIDSTLLSEFKPEWTPNTILLCNFDNTIDGGNVINLPESLTHWGVYKLKNNSNKLEFVNKVDVNTLTLIDYNVTNNTNYKYYIFPITTNRVGEPNISDETTTNWWNWCLFDITESNQENVYNVNQLWLFDLNLESGSLKQNINKATYDNFTKYPKTSTGKKNYLSGSLKCLIGNINNAYCEYTDNIEMMNDFQDFIINSNRKILKDRKGNIWEIDILENSFKFDDVTIEQLNTIEFSFIQKGDCSDISITD